MFDHSHPFKLMFTFGSLVSGGCAFDSHIAAQTQMWCIDSSTVWSSRGPGHWRPQPAGLTQVLLAVQQQHPVWSVQHPHSKGRDLSPSGAWGPVSGRSLSCFLLIPEHRVSGHGKPVEGTPWLWDHPRECLEIQRKLLGSQSGQAIAKTNNFTSTRDV